MAVTLIEHSARNFFLRCRASRATAPAKIASPSSPLRLRRGIATETERVKKPYYVTSPIFYVNAAPHVGHLYTIVISDILKRWQVLRGEKDAVLLTGTDEHGMKIQKAAKIASMDVKAFCDQHASQFEDLAQKADIKYDRFIRTTDKDHRDVVQHFWTELKYRDLIYQAKHEGWYSVSDETFYPESQVHLVLDPSTGRKMYASMETGKEVEWTSEQNWHFRLSSFRDRLLEHYRENPLFILPQSRMRYVVSEVEKGLSDLSVSRPASRLTWGIPVPVDASQTIYVWLDALINYLTMSGWPQKPAGADNSIWPPNVQVIGKDIVRFHCVYWPAFLMALDLPLPTTLLTHDHWTLNSEKMSKSLGNVVNPFFAMDRFEVDVIRYYMAYDGPLKNDAPYENAFIIDRYKKGLQDSFGNLVSRIVRGKLWNVRECVALAEGRAHKGYFQPVFSRQERRINNAAADVALHMDELNPREALQRVMELVFDTNKYMQTMQPWDNAKRDHPEDQKYVKMVVFQCAEAIRVAAILLQPFMPSKMERALDLLGVDASRRQFHDAQYGVDFSYGKAAMDVGKGTEGTLFPPLLAEL